MSKNNKERKVRGYAIYHKQEGDIADCVFSSRRSAKDYFDVGFQSTKIQFPNIPDRNLETIKKSYTIIPITISYKIPKKK